MSKDALETNVSNDAIENVDNDVMEEMADDEAETVAVEEEEAVSTEPVSPLKRVWSIVSKVLTGIVVAITVGMMIFTIVSSIFFDENEKNLFGIRFYIVLSDSMSPSELNKDFPIHFNAGDLVLSKIVDNPYALQPGQVISFVSQNEESFGETFTHAIREVRKTKEGKVIGYVTYGTNTDTNDIAIVQPEYVLGTYWGHLPAIGHFFNFLKTTPGYIVCILVPFLLLILYQGVSTVQLFRRYRKEQMADMEEERAQIAEERKQSAEMMQELLALREQLSRSGVTLPTDIATPMQAEEPAEQQGTDAPAASDETNS